MTNLIRSQACAVALAMGFSGSAMAADVPAGQLLFVSGAVKIVDALGVERAAKKGDKIGPEERIVTGNGATGQIKMSDGSLIGVRPESDLMFDKMKPGDGKSPDARVMFLRKGAVRVVNVDNGSQKKHLPVLLRTPTATIDLRNADNESIVVPTATAGGAKPVVDPGTYSRMVFGDGVIKTTGGETSLGASQTAFAGTDSTTLPPTKIAAIPDRINMTVLPVTPSVTKAIPSGSPSLPDKIAVPVTGLITVRPVLPPTVAVVKPDISIVTSPVISRLAPIAIAPVAPIIIQPIKPPTLVNAGSIDVSKVSTEKLATLPTATLATLPQATLEKLPPATLATLPPETIKSLTPTVQVTVTPLLTATQKTAVTTAVAAPTKTSTIVPITTKTPLKTTTLLLK